MRIRYLYVDDEQNRDIKPLITELEHFSYNCLSIEHIRVRSMKDIISKFSSEDFDGLIIDHKLDAVNEDGYSADYWGTSLAQNFRTEMIGGAIKSAPIVLLSNEDVFVKYYDLDESAHNLFDYAVGKNKVAGCEVYAKKASRIILSLAKAYKIAREEVQPNVDIHQSDYLTLLEPILKWDSNIFEFTDKRFIEYAAAKSHDIHTLVSLILNNFVRSADILVTEDMLATRLGVDYFKSPGWNKLKEQLTEFKYSGVFSELKDRWWFSRIEDWWFTSFPGQKVMRALTATERVAILNDSLKLELKPISPKYTNGQQSEKFWVNCALSSIPLDPFDAIQAKSVDLKPWEQPIYLDVSVVYRREHVAKYSISQEDQKKIVPMFNKFNQHA